MNIFSSRSVWAGLMFSVLFSFTALWALNSGGSSSSNALAFTSSVHVVGADAGAVQVTTQNLSFNHLGGALFSSALNAAMWPTQSKSAGSPANLSGGAVASAGRGASGKFMSDFLGSGATSTFSLLDNHLYPYQLSTNTSGGADAGCIQLSLSSVQTNDLFKALWDGVDPGFGIRANSITLPPQFYVYQSRSGSGPVRGT